MTVSILRSFRPAVAGVVAGVVLLGALGTAAIGWGSAAHPSSGGFESPLAPSPLRAGGAAGVYADSKFDQRVASTATELRQAGFPPQDVRLPYVGTPARLVDGVVEPGPVAALSNVTPYASASPAPSGIAYYGESQPGSTVQATTLYASSVAGTLTVSKLSALSLDVDTPGVWGIQLNSVLTNVTLQGGTGYQFWTQNAVDYYAENSTINFGEDTWNFSSEAASVPVGGSTIAAQSPSGEFVGGLQVAEGPFLSAPMPFSLALYLNSSVTASGDQELWFNYTLLPAGGPLETGNYAWEIFNSTNPSHPGFAALAPFQASGTMLDPIGAPNDFELDFGIGGFNGANIDDLAANATATLDYCPSATPLCSSSTYQSVPAAEDYGGETGETSDGLSITYSGTTATATAGPALLRGLWGFSGAAGSSSGSTPVRNAVAIAGAPDGGGSVPYVFVFLNLTTSIDTTYEWAPDVPVWYLAPGTYHYEIELADYAEATGTLVVGGLPTQLAVTLSYHPASGVYTPLWALNDSALAGISTSGSGTIFGQYELFNNPTSDCSDCANASDGNLSSSFASWNDLLYPTFAGVLLVSTDAYVEVDHPPTFDVFADIFSSLSPSLTAALPFYLQIEFLGTQHVTLTGDDTPGGWPAMFETLTLAGTVGGDQDLFPTANVVVWNSTDDLIMSNEFVDPGTVPTYSSLCISICAAVKCNDCGPTDGLLLYGGTRNTVWGNTFEDAEMPGEYTGSYGGLAEAESGDLIYNNNFSVDNPTVDLPFDLYNDSCPFGFAGDCLPTFLPTYSDTWNVSNQSSSTVSASVNGFPLSGNVLGAGCPFQGGNFWSTYGDALNPTGTLPFVNVYNYSEDLPMLPPGTLADQAGIRIGGDDLPLTRGGCTSPPPSTYPVTFSQSGLPSGTNWSVTLGTTVNGSTLPTIGFQVSNGTYSYVVGAVAGYASAPSAGNVTVQGSAVSESIVFSPIAPTYGVTFFETGLPGATLWYVNLTGAGSIGIVGDSATEPFANGSYGYSVASSDKEYAPTPARGTFSVHGTGETVNVTFVPVLYLVTFTESGLPSGTLWSVVFHGSTNSSGGATIGFVVPNGTYGYSIGVVAGYTATPPTGSVSVSGPGTVVSAAYAPTSTSSSGGRGFLGLSTTDWIGVVGGIAAVVVLGGTGAWAMRRRRERPPPDAGTASPPP